MEIKDLQPNAGNVDLVIEIVEKDDPRTFEKFGKEGRVCNAKVKDNSGEVTLTLWNEDVDKVNIGDRIHLQNGWCSEYKGEKQVSSGKFGKIDVVEKSEANTVFTNDPKMMQPPEEMLEETSEDTTEDTAEDTGDESEEKIEVEDITG